MTTGGIQSQVNTLPAPGIAGEFCDANPRYTLEVGSGGAVAGPNGVNVGLFGWASYAYTDSNSAPAQINNYGQGPVAGFIGRAEQGLNTTFLSNASNFVPSGLPLTVFTAGGFWVVNSGANQALPGMKVYANLSTGAATFAAAGAPTTASATSSSIATGTAATFTGVLNGNTLTATSVTNTIYLGAILSGTNIATNTKIISQTSGTAGGAGVYQVDIGEQSISSESMTATPYVLDTTGGTVTGTIAVGGILATAGGTATGTVVGMAVYSSYATGKWVMANPTAGLTPGTVTSGTITVASNVETSWVCRSPGLAGEIVKISNLPAGG